MEQYQLIIITNFVFVETSNVLLLLALCKCKKKLNLTDKLFIYLTCIDVISMLSFSVLNLLNLTNVPVVMTLTIVTTITQTLDMITFCTISFLRYWSLKRPFLRINTRTVQSALGCEFILVILVSAVILIPSMLVPLDTTVKELTQRTSGAIVLLALLSVVTINILSYIRLKRNKFRRKKNQETTSKVSQTTVNEQEIDGGMIRSDKRKGEAVKTLMIITFFYVVCSSLDIKLWNQCCRVHLENKETQRILQNRHIHNDK